MSYLDATRLVFSGDFLSDVSTVNNDPAHYNNETFVSSFQDFGKGATNGWWNPEGGATFSFQNCIVKQVSMENGDAVSDASKDIIVGQIVCGTAGRNTGKMVDLDPQEQGSSELWGVKLRIVTAKDELLFEGDILHTGFRDLQTRQQTGGNINGQPFGGTWTSVIKNIVWGELAESSPFIKELKGKTQQDKLSVNLNAFGYYYNHAADGRFSLGRIIGSIGPWYENEPETFAPGRRLYGNYISRITPGGLPIIFFSNSNFLYDHKAKRLAVDFGSSFPISDTMGSISFSDKIFLAAGKVAVTAGLSQTPVVASSSDYIMIGEVEYQTGPGWLNNTGGIVSFNNINADAAASLENNQLLLLRLSSSGQYNIIARESIGGYLMRADNFVNRLDYGQVNKVDFYAYQWGKPLAGATVLVTLEPATPVTPKDPKNPICEIPGNNYPPEGITAGTPPATDSNGHTVLSLTGNRIDSPRVYIDGQIYTYDYQLAGITPDPAMGPLSNDNIFVHLRDYFEVPAAPVWPDISAMMTQFANLYPIMSKYFINLADPAALIAKKEILYFAFSRDITDPVYMPVTRDLSETKKETLLKWLTNPLMGDATVANNTQEKLVQHTTEPVMADQPPVPLTDNQQRLKNAVRAKNGAGFVPFEIENIFND